MNRFRSRWVWICMTASVSLVVAVLVGRSLIEQDALVSGKLTASDIHEIRSVVGLRNYQGWNGRRPNWMPNAIQSWAGNRSFPIRSISVTTNNLHEINRGVLADLALRAATNPADEIFQKKFENYARTRPSSPSNQAVQVWYLDKNARWGEAGYTVEKCSNVWAISVTLFR